MATVERNTEALERTPAQSIGNYNRLMIGLIEERNLLERQLRQRGNSDADIRKMLNNYDKALYRLKMLKGDVSKNLPGLTQKQLDQFAEFVFKLKGNQRNYAFASYAIILLTQEVSYLYNATTMDLKQEAIRIAGDIVNQLNQVSRNPSKMKKLADCIRNYMVAMAALRDGKSTWNGKESQKTQHNIVSNLQNKITETFSSLPAEIKTRVAKTAKERVIDALQGELTVDYSIFLIGQIADIRQLSKALPSTNDILSMKIGIVNESGQIDMTKSKTYMFLNALPSQINGVKLDPKQELSSEQRDFLTKRLADIGSKQLASDLGLEETSLRTNIGKLNEDQLFRVWLARQFLRPFVEKKANRKIEDTHVVGTLDRYIMQNAHDNGVLYIKQSSEVTANDKTSRSGRDALAFRPSYVRGVTEQYYGWSAHVSRENIESTISLLADGIRNIGAQYHGEQVLQENKTPAHQVAGHQALQATRQVVNTFVQSILDAFLDSYIRFENPTSLQVLVEPNKEQSTYITVAGVSAKQSPSARQELNDNLMMRLNPRNSPTRIVLRMQEANKLNSFLVLDKDIVYFAVNGADARRGDEREESHKLLLNDLQPTYEAKEKIDVIGDEKSSYVLRGLNVGDRIFFIQDNSLKAYYLKQARQDGILLKGENGQEIMLRGSITVDERNLFSVAIKGSELWEKLQPNGSLSLVKKTAVQQKAVVIDNSDLSKNSLVVDIKLSTPEGEKVLNGVMLRSRGPPVNGVISLVSQDGQVALEVNNVSVNGSAYIIPTESLRRVGVTHVYQSFSKFQDVQIDLYSGNLVGEIIVPQNGALGKVPVKVDMAFNGVSASAVQNFSISLNQDNAVLSVPGANVSIEIPMSDLEARGIISKNNHAPEYTVNVVGLMKRFEEETQGDLREWIGFVLRNGFDGEVEINHSNRSGPIVNPISFRAISRGTSLTELSEEHITEIIMEQPTTVKPETAEKQNGRISINISNTIGPPKYRYEKEIYLGWAITYYGSDKPEFPGQMTDLAGAAYNAWRSGVEKGGNPTVGQILSGQGVREVLNALGLDSNLLYRYLQDIEQKPFAENPDRFVCAIINALRDRYNNDTLLSLNIVTEDNERPFYVRDQNGNIVPNGELFELDSEGNAIGIKDNSINPYRFEEVKKELEKRSEQLRNQPLALFSFPVTHWGKVFLRGNFLITRAAGPGVGAEVCYRTKIGNNNYYLSLSGFVGWSPNSMYYGAGAGIDIGDLSIGVNKIIVGRNVYRPSVSVGLNVAR